MTDRPCLVFSIDWRETTGTTVLLKDYYCYRSLRFKCLRLGEISLLEEHPINMVSETSSLIPG